MKILSWIAKIKTLFCELNLINVLKLKRIFPKKNFSVRATNTNMEINFDDNADAVKFVNQKEGLSFKSMSVSKKSPETVVIEF